MGNKLNIVYIGPLSFPLGFASTKRRRYMIDYMNSKGIQSNILCTRYKKTAIFNNNKEGVYGIANYYDLSDNIKKLAFLSYYSKGFKKIKEWFKSSSKNVMIFHTSMNIEDFPFYLYAKYKGYKIIFDQVETSYAASGTNVSMKRYIYTKTNDFVSKIAYKYCNGSFVISDSLYKENEQRYPNMPLCLLPNSTPILQKQKKNSFSTPPTILYSGTYAPKDGIEYLLKAFMVLKEESIPCKLLLTGKGSDKDMRILANYKSHKDIIYMGMVSDSELEKIISNSDILTMTRNNSKFANYGFPFKVSEYLSTGNPVLATKVSDISQYLTHKKDAYLVESEDVDSIATGLKYLITNEKEALTMGVNGLETMKEKFSIDIIGEKFISFIDKI